LSPGSIAFNPFEYVLSYFHGFVEVLNEQSSVLVDEFDFKIKLFQVTGIKEESESKEVASSVGPLPVV
jgi:hypothetical protein